MNRIAFFQDYLNEHPDDRFAMYSLALEQKKAGLWSQAEASFVRFIDVHPSSGAGHYQYGMLLVELERLEQAKEAFEAGLNCLKGLTDPDSRKSRAELQLALDEVEDQLEND